MSLQVDVLHHVSDHGSTSSYRSLVTATRNLMSSAGVGGVNSMSKFAYPPFIAWAELSAPLAGLHDTLRMAVPTSERRTTLRASETESR